MLEATVEGVSRIAFPARALEAGCLQRPDDGKDAALKAARKELSARYARRRAVKEELAEA